MQNNVYNWIIVIDVFMYADKSVANFNYYICSLYNNIS